MIETRIKSGPTRAEKVDETKSFKKSFSADEVKAAERIFCHSLPVTGAETTTIPTGAVTQVANVDSVEKLIRGFLHPEPAHPPRENFESTTVKPS